MVKTFTVVRGHMIYFEELDDSHYVLEATDESGKVHFVRAPNGSFDYVGAITPWPRVRGMLLGHTLLEATQTLVKNWVTKAKDPVISWSTEGLEAVKRLEEKYL